MQTNLIRSNLRHGLVSWLAGFALLATALSWNAPYANAAEAKEFDPKLDWPGWRGPTADGIAAPGQTPPIRWNETSNVLWQTRVPGHGHGSPCVIGARIYLPTSEPDKQNQSVLCFDRADGKLLWQREVHNGQANRGNHANSSCASSTLSAQSHRRGARGWFG